MEVVWPIVQFFKIFPGLFQGVILCSIPFSLELPNRSPWVSSAITWFAGAYAKIRPGAELFGTFDLILIKFL